MVSSIQPVRIDAEGPSVPAWPVDGADLSEATALVESERMGRGDCQDRARSFSRNGSCRSMGLVGHADPGSCGPKAGRFLVVRGQELPQPERKLRTHPVASRLAPNATGPAPALSIGASANRNPGPTPRPKPPVDVSSAAAPNCARETQAAPLPARAAPRPGPAGRFRSARPTRARCSRRRRSPESTGGRNRRRCPPAP